MIKNKEEYPINMDKINKKLSQLVMLKYRVGKQPINLLFYLPEIYNFTLYLYVEEKYLIIKKGGRWYKKVNFLDEQKIVISKLVYTARLSILF